MTQLTDTAVKPTVLDLPPTLDADAAGALIAQMSKLAIANEIRLDAASVTALSPGYLQILVSAFKTFPHLSVCNASVGFVDAFAGWGIDYPQAAAAPLEVTAAPSILSAELAVTPEPEPVRPTVASPAIPIVAAPEPAIVAAPKPTPAPATRPERKAEPIVAAKPERMLEPMPVVDPESAPEAEPPGPPPVALAAKTILTIDDSRTMRDMLNMALSGAGFTVVQAVDGQDGLKVLAQQPVDLIITDINMPKLDGYGVIRAVRKDPAYNSTPILVLSTEAEQESKDIAKDAGATGWIVKPFDPAGLVNIVNSVCG